MLDPEIREKLFFRLETTSSKIRIFEEVIIGESRCDAFAVTDKLTGFEIKSDADSYARLKSQIKSYDRFFNENYLVVGEKHRKSASAHIPDHWGLICVGEDVEVIRSASASPKVSIKNQLRLLWKRELRRVLSRYSVHKYERCSRQYLTKRLMDFVDEERLLSEICAELFERDYVTEGFFDPVLFDKQNPKK
ncbi:MAG: sce7726 family protein [Ruminococcus sp.]|nr:sce7726 family protein [Ruminococcus sp.]